MSDDLFKEGGPHDIKRSGDDEYQFSIQLPKDEDGMLGRECKSSDCSPAYFKVRPGTGITEGQVEAFCPYYRHSGEPQDFTTKAQTEYAKSLVMREAEEGIDRLVTKTLGIGPSGKKKIGGGFISMELSYKPGTPRSVPRPFEEELRRDVVCPNCGLQHAVFGLATWCPDCGMDIFLSHVAEEFKAIEKVIAAVGDRRANLGARLAGRDIENALEDTVSIFEAVMKVITRRHLLNAGATQDEVHEIIEKKIRSRFQSIHSAKKIFEDHLGFPLLEAADDADVKLLEGAFVKRHPITHNLGIVDRKYLQGALSGESEGREIRVSEEEVLKTARIAHSIVARAYKRAFPDSYSVPVDG